MKNKQEQEEMQTCIISIPKGKKVEWINGVLTLVDDEKQKDVTERVKTFEDACNELGENNRLVEEYRELEAVDLDTPDILAYLKLRIICAALNEGWLPQFTEDETRYYPYFVLYTQEVIDNMDEDERKGLWLFGGLSDYGASCGLAFAGSSDVWSYSRSYFSARLVFRTRELAIYAGKQFKEIWADYVFLKREEYENDL